ncbi:MAG: TIGR02530 family flagellar biosynthesis protein [Candidatus Hydrogenedentota bacterium]
MIERVQLTHAQGVGAGAPLPKAEVPQTSFSDVLARVKRSQSPLRYSAHAIERLRQRNISLSDAEKTALEQSVEHAAAKGSRETLLVTEDAAFVVSVANRTVITAVPRSEMDGAVFTNIDSAVVVAPCAARG